MDHTGITDGGRVTRGEQFDGVELVFRGTARSPPESPCKRVSLERRVVPCGHGVPTTTCYYYAISMNIYETRRSIPVPKMPLHRSESKLVYKCPGRGTGCVEIPTSGAPGADAQVKGRRGAKMFSTAKGGLTVFTAVRAPLLLHFFCVTICG